jgi:hypothetical protein
MCDVDDLLAQVHVHPLFSWPASQVSTSDLHAVCSAATCPLVTPNQGIPGYSLLVTQVLVYVALFVVPSGSHRGPHHGQPAGELEGE